MIGRAGPRIGAFQSPVQEPSGKIQNAFLDSLFRLEMSPDFKRRVPRFGGTDGKGVSFAFKRQVRTRVFRFPGRPSLAGDARVFGLERKVFQLEPPRLETKMRGALRQCQFSELRIGNFERSL